MPNLKTAFTLCAALGLGALGPGGQLAAQERPVVKPGVLKEIQNWFASTVNPPSAQALALKNAGKHNLFLCNQSKERWTIRCVNDLNPAQLAKGSLGSMTVAQVADAASDPVKWTATKAWKAGDPPLVLEPGSSLVQITPALDKDFAQLFQVQDKNGKAFYLTITRKANATTGPQFGIAALSSKLVNEQKLIMFSSQDSTNFTLVGLFQDFIK